MTQTLLQEVSHKGKAALDDVTLVEGLKQNSRGTTHMNFTAIYRLLMKSTKKIVNFNIKLLVNLIITLKEKVFETNDSKLKFYSLQCSPGLLILF